MTSLPEPAAPPGPRLRWSSRQPLGGRVGLGGFRKGRAGPSSPGAGQERTPTVSAVRGGGVCLNPRKRDGVR